MVVYVCTKFHKNILDGIESCRADTIFPGKISKGHNSVKMWVELRLFFSAHRHMVVYICKKFHENILDGINGKEWTCFL